MAEWSKAPELGTPLPSPVERFSGLSRDVGSNPTPVMIDAYFYSFKRSEGGLTSIFKLQAGTAKEPIPPNMSWRRDSDCGETPFTSSLE